MYFIAFVNMYLLYFIHSLNRYSTLDYMFAKVNPLDCKPIKQSVYKHLGVCIIELCLWRLINISAL